MNHFGELLTAAITPFDKNGVVETDTFWRLCKKLVSEGSNGIVLTGTTAESPNLTESDRLNIYSTAKDAVGDNAKLIAGTGTYSTKETVTLTKLAEETGMDGVMIVTPYYNKPSQIGILKHFQEVMNNTNLPVMAYNIPGRTGTLIELDTLCTLVRDIGIHSIKDAVGDFEFSFKELTELKNETYIYSGDDALTLDFLKNGAVGLVSVASHVLGKQIRKMIDHFLSNEITNAEEIETIILPLIHALFEEPSPGAVKHLLTISWENVGFPQLPMTTVSDELAKKLNDLYVKLNN
ncbi:MAG: 4-hydroxy-tetrahydrodipicolinate synthase [Candidatus Actinomarina sp.]|nr:4-hydroxy-tetrahydrodipicolinate synthase [Candidatus Actinomarina sp.]